jgi:hypothetical protein
MEMGSYYVNFASNEKMKKGSAVRPATVSDEHPGALRGQSRFNEVIAESIEHEVPWYR